MSLNYLIGKNNSEILVIFKFGKKKIKILKKLYFKNY